MKYIMVTDWRDHWDKIPGGLTAYSTIMLVPPMSTARLVNGTSTIFLRFSSGPRAPLKAWTGKVTDISYSLKYKRVGFRVKIGREIRFPRKCADLDDGWFLEEHDPGRTPSGLW
jgi:hypothetical protein